MVVLQGRMAHLGAGNHVKSHVLVPPKMPLMTIEKNVYKFSIFPHNS